MHKKTVLWISLFVFLFVANLYLTLTYLAKVKRAQAASRILDEIVESGLNTGPVAAGEPTIDNTAMEGSAKLADARVANLKSFFRKYNSPLYDYADLIVKTADKYAFDYRLVPAIAMQESGVCNVIPPGSHNCWGWGIYGNTITRFGSYDEAIETVSKGLRTHYLDHGLVTATQIMEKYTPSSQGSWARGVNSVLNALQ
jgi:hypothetical protein